MSTPYFDDAARDLFDEILTETIAEYREEKAARTPEPPAEPPVPPQEPPAPQPVVPRPRTPQERLHRAMYVLDMHKGRPHAAKPAFQRRWLEEAMRAIVILLAELPEDDDTT
jgi:hypothetical protein